MARVTLAGLALAAWLAATAFAPGRGGERDGPGRPTPPARSPTGGASPDDAGPARPEFKAAGVCARCHVVSVLEWGISGHVAAGTDCQKCHGPSKAHVANERNEVKPDRLPRGAQIAQTCQRCHDAGCPKTLETAACQKCH